MTVKCCELESRQKHLRQAKIKDVAQNYEEKKNVLLKKKKIIQFLMVTMTCVFLKLRKALGLEIKYLEYLGQTIA